MLENTTVSKFPNDGGTYTSTETSLFAGANGKALRDAIDTLYDAFADARLSSPLEGCLHCFTAADLDYLRGTPLRALTHGDLSLIASNAISTLGMPVDLIYFVPRLIEALAEHALIEIDPLAERLAQIPRDALTREKKLALKAAVEQLFKADDLDGNEWTELHLHGDALRRALCDILDARLA